jgi:chromosome segregation ATPase
MSAAHKLKAVDPTAPAREEIRSALSRIQELRAALDLNAKDIDAARAEIRRLESELEEAQKAVASAPALQRRAAQAKADDIAAQLEDHQAHLLELKKHRGHDPAFDRRDWRSLEAKIEDEESRIRECRRQILKASPVVARLVDKLLAMRLEMLTLQENVRLVWSIGGIVPRTEPGHAPSDTFWSEAPYRYIPRPDAAWVAAVEALLTDPDTALPEG